MNKKALNYWEKYKALVEVLPDCVKFFNLKGELVYINKCGLKEHRLKSLSDAKKKKWKAVDTIVKKDQGLFLKAMKRAAKGKAGVIGIKHTKKGATRDYCEEAIAPVRDEEGKIIGIIATSRDISDKKRFDEQLVKEKERAENYLNIAGNIIVALNHEGKITMINKKGNEVLGYKNGDLIGKDWFNTCLPKKNIKEVRIAFNKMMKGYIKPVRTYENPIITRGGEERIVSWRNSLIKDEKGKITGALSYGDDVTKSKKAEKELWESEERFRTLVEQAPISVQIMDPKGITVQVNKAWEKLWGLKMKDLRGYNMLKDKQLVRLGIIKHIRSAYNGGPSFIPAAEYDAVDTLGKGLKRWVQARVYPVKGKSKKLQYVVLMHEDITERKIAEKRRDLLLRAVELTPEAINIISPEGKLTYTNEAMDNLFGYKKDELNGKQADILIMEPRSKLMSDIVKLITKEGLWEGEVNNVRKDGTEFISAVKSAPVKDEKNNIVNIVTAQHDITKMKEVDRAKTEFVSLASHQLRTPIAAMSWYLEMLLGGDAGELNKKQQDYAEKVFRSNKRMSSLVGALLNVSRIELGTFIVEPKPVNIKKITKSVINEFLEIIKSKKLKLDEKYVSSVPKSMRLDDKLTRIIIQNLLSNAIKYTPKNGKVQIKIEKINKNIKITVNDTGYGIPRGQQDKIFTKLFRADNIKQRDTDGTGLGLYLTKSILDYTGGEIRFKSAENKGSTFYVTMPMAHKRKKGTRILE